MRARRAASLAAVVAGLLVLVPCASGRSQANPTLLVSFSAGGAITATLGDGTPLGTASGAPSVIPAGYYTVSFTGPGGCTELPYFDLEGPGVQLFQNMDLGEVSATSAIYLVPGSTYTWKDDGANPAVTYTFATSATVVGTPSASGASGVPAVPAATGVTSNSLDIVGSGIVPFRGTLVGSVSAAGKLALTYHGKPVGSLQAGRYTVVVNDRSASNGFVLEKGREVVVARSGASFVGTHSFAVVLSTGRWFVSTGPSARATALTVVH